MQKDADNGEADDLGQQMGPVYAESIGNLLDLSTAIRPGQQQQSTHGFPRDASAAQVLNDARELPYFTKNRA